LSNHKNLTDNQLLQQYLTEDDLSYLGQLYQRYSEMVYYVCLRYLKNTEDSKDAVMQIFEDLIIKTKRQTIQDFPKWLYVVSKNYCLMVIRSRKNKPEIVTEDFVEFSFDLHQIENVQKKEEQLLKLEACIEILRADQKKSIELFYIKQKCYNEISEMTGFSKNEVKSYIQNGKRNLKICMEKRDHE